MREVPPGNCTRKRISLLQMWSCERKDRLSFKRWEVLAATRPRSVTFAPARFLALCDGLDYSREPERDYNEAAELVWRCRHSQCSLVRAMLLQLLTFRRVPDKPVIAGDTIVSALAVELRDRMDPGAFDAFIKEAYERVPSQAESLKTGLALLSALPS